MREFEYIKNTPIGYRKTYGQFFTPKPVARLMAQWVLKNEPKKILDPAFGLGIFYDEVFSNNPMPDTQFIGYEIDERIVDYFNGTEKKPNLTLYHQDYFKARKLKYNSIVCNPPYMRFQNFENRHEVLPLIEEMIGRSLAGYSNLSSVFLVKAIHELKADGNLAFIMPFEFFNTGYGKEIKKILIDTHLLKQIVLFSNEKEIFPDATTTVCILLCKKDSKKGEIKITKINEGDEIDNISDISDYYQKKIDSSMLFFDKKWTPIIMSLFNDQVTPKNFIPLSEYGAFKRGIATGANEFFALSKTKINNLKLSYDNVCKCITKSNQVRKPVFTESDFQNLDNSDKPVYCLDVTNHKDKFVREYIDKGEQLGFHKRYLTRQRKPWYKLENREPASILFGVFSRGRLKVIRNYSTSINFTCFHSFYPNALSSNLIDKLFLYFLSDVGQEILKINKRSYGNNLDKFEPGDLNGCLCPTKKQFELIEKCEVDKVISTAKKDEYLGISLSNDLINRILSTYS